MSLLFPLPTASLPVVGSHGRFPVRRIYCVGRNYLDHVREMREADERDAPFFFQKPADAVVGDGGHVPYPPRTADLQFEGELVVAIGSEAENVAPDRAGDVVFGYAAGIDLTRRDRQRECHRRRIPWEAGKSFDAAAPCGSLVPRGHVPDITAAELTLEVNGAVRQRARIAQMIWSIPEIIAQLSGDYRLMPGDLVFTGTPSRVGAVRPGDKVRVEVSGVPPLTVTIAGPARAVAPAARSPRVGTARIGTAS